jgi:Domain of unknown function (DUF3859)
MSGISRFTSVISRLFLLISAVLLTSSCAWVGLGGAKSKIVDYGLYDAKVVTKGSNIVSASGAVLKQTTLSVPAEAGRYFGMRVEIVNPRKDATSTYRFQVDHPAVISPDGQSSSQFSHEFGLQPGESSTQEFIWYFVKGASYEIVPGKWTMRVFVNSREVAKKQFTVGG